MSLVLEHVELEGRVETDIAACSMVDGAFRVALRTNIHMLHGARLVLHFEPSEARFLRDSLEQHLRGGATGGVV